MTRLARIKKTADIYIEPLQFSVQRVPAAPPGRGRPVRRHPTGRRRPPAAPPSRARPACRPRRPRRRPSPWPPAVCLGYSQQEASILAQQRLLDPSVGKLGDDANEPEQRVPPTRLRHGEVVPEPLDRLAHRCLLALRLERYCDAAIFTLAHPGDAHAHTYHVNSLLDRRYNLVSGVRGVFRLYHDGVSGSGARVRVRRARLGGGVEGGAGDGLALRRAATRLAPPLRAQCAHLLQHAVSAPAPARPLLPAARAAGRRGRAQRVPHLLHELSRSLALLHRLGARSPQFVEVRLHVRIDCLKLHSVQFVLQGVLPLAESLRPLLLGDVAAARVGEPQHHLVEPAQPRENRLFDVAVEVPGPLELGDRLLQQATRDPRGLVNRTALPGGHH